MAQNNAPPSAAASKQMGKPIAPTRARLILQDPSAFDQATQPALRSSTEMLVEPTPSMEREKARELWENLSLDPEVAQERQSERKRLLARADQLTRETAAAKAQAVALQAQLSRERDERLNHPLVYAGAAGLLAVGAMYWLERRKRILLQDRQLDAWAQESSPRVLGEQQLDPLEQRLSKAALPHLPTPQIEPLKAEQALDIHPELQDSLSVLSLEELPDLAKDFATDLSGLPEQPPQPPLLNEKPTDLPELLPAKNPHVSTSVPMEKPALQKIDKPSHWAQPNAVNLPEKTESRSPAEDDLLPMSWETQDRSLLAMSKRVLGNMLHRRSRNDGLSSSVLPTDSPSSSHQSTLVSTSVSHSAFQHSGQYDDASQMLYDDEAQLAFEQELLEQQLNTDKLASFNPAQANIDLLSQTPVTAQRGESAMEHLLELRTAVSGLCALGRPEGAAQLLEEHIAADPGTCAWAYLEYMHICEQLDQRDEFESTRKRYRQHFNRMAPYWHEPNSNVLGLDGYARAASELCAAWAQGRGPAFSALAAWLAGPLLGRKLVQLPAYHDLFDLYELLEFVEDQDRMTQQLSGADAPLSAQHAIAHAIGSGPSRPTGETDEEFVPTVSLLDLDYEFSSDVTLEEREVEQSEKAVTVVKTGNFSVDFNVAGTQMGSLSSLPAVLEKK